MTALCYVLAGVCAGLTGLLATALVWWHSSVQETKANLIAAQAAQRNQLTAESQRDIEKTARVKAEAERDAANQQLKDTQVARNAADKERTENAAESVRNADVPLDALNELFKESDRSADAAGQPATDGPGHA